MMKKVQSLELNDPEEANLKIWAEGGLHLLGQEERICHHLQELEFTGALLLKQEIKGEWLKVKELGEELPHRRKDFPLQKQETVSPLLQKEMLVAEMRYR